MFVCCVLYVCVGCDRFAPMRARVRVCAFTRARAFARHCARVFACPPRASVRLCVARGALWRRLVLRSVVLGPRIPVSPFVCIVACMRVRGAAWRGVVWRGGW